MSQSELPPIAAASQRRGCLFYGAIALVLSTLIFVAGIFAAIWWIQRPLDPVVLDAEEKMVVEEKVETLQKSAEPRYQAGKKQISFTEHELNGLLNQHTDLGETLKFEVDQDALSAYIVHTLPADSPFMAGKTLKGRATLEVVFDQNEPQLRVKDLTVYGISVPNAWLGGIKDQNLARDLFGGGAGGNWLNGIKDLRLENGKIELELNE